MSERIEDMTMETLNARILHELMFISRGLRRGRREGPGDHGPHGPHMPHDPHGPRGPHRGPHFPDGPVAENMPYMRRPRHGLSRERILEILLGHEEGMRQKEIGEALGINPSAISEMISRLTEEGYLKRTVDPEDRRATRVTLTELGYARACEVADERSQRLGTLFQNLTRQEREELLRLLQKIHTDNEEEV